MKEPFPRLGPFADQREALRALVNDPRIHSPREGRQRLPAWMEQVRTLGLPALTKFCKTLANWLAESANYFRRRSSNGRTEGLNQGIRALLWRAFGLANFQNFRSRVLHCFGFASS